MIGQPILLIQQIGIHIYISDIMSVLMTKHNMEISNILKNIKISKNIEKSQILKKIAFLKIDKKIYRKQIFVDESLGDLF